jgi:hypothetical protein
MNTRSGRKYGILAADVLCIPGLILCERLSTYLLSLPGECQWARLGGKCVTCGGTHFVNALLNGRLGEAFQYNAFLFLLSVLLAMVFLLLNLHWLWDVRFSGKILAKLFSIPTLVVLLCLMLAFFLARNIPLFLRIAHWLLESR